MNTSNQLYRGYRFPSEIISHAIWLYHRFCLSFRDIEDLLAERGIVVSYETIRSWCKKFGPVSLSGRTQKPRQLLIGWKCKSQRGTPFPQAYQVRSYSCKPASVLEAGLFLCKFCANGNKKGPTSPQVLDYLTFWVASPRGFELIPQIWLTSVSVTIT